MANHFPFVDRNNVFKRQTSRCSSTTGTTLNHKSDMQPITQNPPIPPSSFFFLYTHPHSQTYSLNIISLDLNTERRKSKLFESPAVWYTGKMMEDHFRFLSHPQICTCMLNTLVSLGRSMCHSRTLDTPAAQCVLCRLKSAFPPCTCPQWVPSHTDMTKHHLLSSLNHRQQSRHLPHS